MIQYRESKNVFAAFLQSFGVVSFNVLLYNIYFTMQFPYFIFESQLFFVVVFFSFGMISTFFHAICYLILAFMRLSNDEMPYYKKVQSIYFN